MSSSIFKTIRTDLQATIAAIPALAGVPVMTERTPADTLREEIETALNTQGVAIVVLSVAGAVYDKIGSGRCSMMRVTVPVALVENVTINSEGVDGLRIDSEALAEAVLKGVTGTKCATGTIEPSEQALTRGDDIPGWLEHYIAFDVVIPMRAAS